MKYTVYLYKAVRMYPVEIEAGSQEEAVQIACEQCSSVFDKGLTFEDDEAPCLGAMVDEEGDENYARSRYHEGPGAKVYLGSTPE